VSGGAGAGGAGQPYTGRPVKRVEDPRLLRGRGRYLDDLAGPGLLHVAFVRSPHAHARLLGIDASRARAAPGVVAVVTGEDLAAVPALRSDAMQADECRTTEWPVLARGRVRYVGEAVAAVVAADRYLAEDAVQQVAVEYEALPAVVTITDSLAPGAPRLHDGWPDNLLMRATGSGGGDVEAALRTAPVVLRETFQSSPVTGVPMEPRGCLGALDPSTGVLTLWTSNQIPHVIASMLAEYLEQPEHLLRVVCPDMGGGFGIKTHLYPEDVVIAYLARALGRPVKWTQTRGEDLRCNNYCRDHRLTVEVGAESDGRLLGLRATVEMDAGAYAILPGFNSILEATGAARQILGPYRIPCYAYEAVTVVTNKVPRGAYRGVAMVTTTFTMERVMDLLAARLDLDPAEIRRRNLVRREEFPYRNALGITYEPASFVESLDDALQRIDYPAARARQRAARHDGRLVGIGIAAYAEFTAPSSRALAWRGIVRVPGFDSVSVRMEPGGTVRARTSITALGQGIQTALAQLIADELGVGVDDVVVEVGDSSLAPYGSGAFASRGAVVGGGAAVLAARQIRDKLLAIAAHDLEARADDLEIADGAISVKGAPFRRVAVATVARQAYLVSPTALPDGISPGLDATVYHDPPLQSVSNGAHVAVVEVDAETGAVTVLRYAVAHDCGTLVNPRIVDGQIHGGTVQGLGQALGEAARYDDQGQLLTASLMDYFVPRASDVPAAFEIGHLETPSPHTVRGIKGMGEGGTIGAVAAVANAVADAVAPHGGRVTRLPLTAGEVFGLVATDPRQATRKGEEG
jgi:carbon-monoxide dehydrogenase large subunit